MPEISVVMPVHNREKYVARAIESILTQTYKNFDFILVDDGSTDNSPNIIKQYANKDKRIKYIKQENNGPAHARNTGVKHSKYKYIAFMDDDDISIPERLEKQLKFMENNPKIDACSCLYEMIDISGKHINYTLFKNNNIQVSTDFLKYAFPPSFSLGAETMIKSSVIKRMHGYRTNINLTEDMDFTLRFQENFSAKLILEYLYKYVVPKSNFGDNVTTKDPVNYMKSHIVTYLCAWFRRNTDSDPIAENKTADEIIDLIPVLPRITRESIHSGVPPICNNIIISIKKGKHISDEELISTIKAIKYLSPKKFACKFTHQLKKARIKSLLKQGKLIQAKNIIQIKS